MIGVYIILIMLEINIISNNGKTLYHQRIGKTFNHIMNYQNYYNIISIYINMSDNMLL